MACGHFKIQCSVCLKVISQCRCMTRDKAIRYEICGDCVGEPPTAREYELEAEVKRLRAGLQAMVDSRVPYVDYYVEEAEELLKGES